MRRLSRVEWASAEQQCEVGIAMLTLKRLCDWSKVMLFGLGSDDDVDGPLSEMPNPTSWKEQSNGLTDSPPM